MLALLLACAEPETQTIAGRHTDLVLQLVNPTDCSSCDPFFEMDTLVIQIEQDGVVVNSANFSWPDETPELPDLEGFGVVRIVLVGLSAGTVVSAGRTPEIVLEPDTELTVPVMFLPVNRALPLAETLGAPRSLHVALTRRDGAVILAGGVAPDRSTTYDSVERYDPAAGTFTTLPVVLPEAVAAPAIATSEEFYTLLTGGEQITDAGPIDATVAALYNEADDSFTLTEPLSVGRAGHCLSFFGDRHALALGGNPESADADYFHPVDEVWTSTNIRMQDFDATAVSGCVGLIGGGILVIGRDSASTGTWSFDVTGNGSAGESFTALNDPGEVRYASGATLIPRADGGVWVGGGFTIESGLVDAAGRTWSASTRTFTTGPDPVEPRYAGSWSPGHTDQDVFLGCGFLDVDRFRPNASLEWLDLNEGSRLVIPLDRERWGCQLSTLHDGSVLVTGGFQAGEEQASGAVLVVPWLD